MELRRGKTVSQTWRNHQYWLMRGQNKFSVKEAYSMIAKPKEGGPMQDQGWSRIWNIKGPQRLHLLLWQARKDRLPTVATLFLRRAVDSPICSLCREAVEFNLHSLRHCKEVKAVWKLLVDSGHHFSSSSLKQLQLRSG
ncbi:hypothetical protein M9H77_34864 [Catharanthus roseus]|uniref:Uncharacterized protein n=1 Tax=Catharanthus roseus TaxID=4058 RepID=A0ACB9ZME1_CATRO|nr:hypothetical protein M9H77_34864 [Catharanthus roseus]